MYDLNELLQSGIHAVDLATLAARDYLGDAGVISSKSKDIKTIADQVMNDAIIERLSVTLIPIISEESDSNSSVSQSFCWIIDPLDGTYNFSRGFPCAGISVSLLKDGLPVMGIIKDIYNGDLYTSLAGQGSKKNGQGIQVSSISRLSDAVLATGFPSGSNFSANSLTQFVSSVREFKKIRSIGAASLMLTYVATGIFDVYYENDIYLWDVAAGLSLVKESGGSYLIKPGSKPFQYQVLASNNKLFEKAKELLFA